MNALWWFALAALALPLWWHRKKREQHKAEPLATARFLPRTEPRQTRVWRFADPLLLLLRCLLLATLVAWLADPVFPWRGDTVVVAEGSDPAWVERQAAQAGLQDAERIAMPAAQAIPWLRTHEREWKPEARLLVLGDIPMPATLPAFGRAVELRTQARAAQKVERHVYIESERAAEWRRLFAAIDGPERVVVDAAPGAKTELIVWDRAGAPPATLKAPLWWITDPAPFPELGNAVEADGVRHAASARGRLWLSNAWPPRDADAARALIRHWQQVHVGPRPYTAPARVFAASKNARAPAPSGALRDLLLGALVALFVLERLLTHARRR
ncbi:N-terminal double-transmembrane domain-containing protein [Massilia sp. KIM]|nr:BatA domain-containing protein [Massilia sp. KIM]OON59958.1 N-terminal double-transmembrane domain-containing protein [Massilia sp. KIM]